MLRIFCAAMIFALAGTASAQQAPPADAVKELAPTGKLRAAINVGNVVLAQRDENGGVRGPSVDLARELARRLAVPIDLHVYDAAGKVTDAAKTGEWDVAFVAIEPARAEGIGFTSPYVIIEGTYLVGTDSPLKSIADVDHDGVRIAVGKGSAYDLFLTRTLQHAALVRYPTSPLALDGFLADKLDAAAGVKQQLVQFCENEPECPRDGRPLPGHPASDGDAARPRCRPQIFERLYRRDESLRLRQECARTLRPVRRPRCAGRQLNRGLSV